MTDFKTMRLPQDRDVVAPDGADVRVLLALEAGSMAHFELAAGETSVAETHHSVEEIWYFMSGHGQMWRKDDNREEVVTVEPGVCISIPVGCEFQWRSDNDEPLAAVAITMPPWPGGMEARKVEGKWRPTVASGPG